MAFLHEFLIFGWKNVRSTVFAGSFLALIALSTVLPLGSLARYDFLFLGALAIQGILIVTKIETVDEAKTIALFHGIGLALEAFKTHPSVGAWSYPQPGVFKVFNVPLFSGFMYAAVGSYVAQSWRQFDLEFRGTPPMWVSWSLCAAVYVNFFTNHFVADVRWVLIAAIIAAFYRARVHYTVIRRHTMPLLLAFVLIGFFVWIAEQIGTWFGAWQYPHQAHGWKVVHPALISSWALMVIISVLLIFNLKVVKSARVATQSAGSMKPSPSRQNAR